MRREDIDPAEFNACIGNALDYVAVRLVELGIQESPAQLTKLRADIEDYTMAAVEAAILPRTPADWCWQKAAKLVAMEVAKQHIREVAAVFGKRLP